MDEYNLDDILLFIIQSDDMKRLLVNNNKNALTEPVPAIPISEYFDKFLFDIQKLPSISDEVKTFICLEFVRARKSGANNTFYYEVELHIDMITHNDTWKLSGNKKRIYTMSDIIDRQLKSLPTNSIKGEFTFDNWNKIIYDTDGMWQGRRLIYNITNLSKNCGD